MSGNGSNDGSCGKALCDAKVRAQHEGNAVDVDESDNEDTGADAEDEGMASQKEQYDELENVSRRHPLQLLQILYRHLRPLPVPTRREEKGSPRTRRLGPAHFALSRTVVQELPGV